MSDHVSLGVLTRVFPPDVVDAVIARTGALEQRNRLLPSRLMVYYVMSLALFSNGSYEEVMRSLLAGMEWLTGRFREWTMPTKAAIYKARTATDFKSAFPQARVLGLVEGGTHAVFSAVVTSYNTSEHDMYPALLADVANDMLLTSDRGFFSYAAWKDSVATGAALLWRMKVNSVLPVLEELKDGSYLSAVYPSTKDRAKDTNGIPVRVIE